MNHYVVSGIFAFAGACGGGGGGGGGGGSGPDGGHSVPSEGISIAAANVHQIGSVDGQGPGPGHLLVAADITLTDGGVKAATLDPQLFAIETDAGVAFSGSALTAAYPDGCLATASVEPGAHGSCSAVFEVDSNMLKALTYTLPDDTVASVSITLAASTAIGQACDATHTCPDGYDCTGSPTTACELRCETSTPTTCEDAYPGPGTAACFAPGGSGTQAYCIITCNSTEPCPGILTCSSTTTQDGLCGGIPE